MNERNPPPCPDAARWRGLLDDALPATEQAALADHLEACAACRDLFAALAAGEPAWEAARELAQASETQTHPGVERFRAPSGLPFLEPSDEEGRIGRFGPYEVMAVVGRGGMGVVLKAFDPSLHRVVAVKVLAPQLSAGVAARKRFVREARAAASVAHEHVVTIHAVDEWKGWPFLVMQYVGGKSLQERIDRSGPLEVKEILRIGMQAARGLAAAHAQGLVHRDIKPANILLENGVERVKLTDFGLARAVDDPSLTQAGVVAGTPQYMSPEQAKGEAVDARSDLFSLGSVLYAMATGGPPFRGDSSIGVIRKVCDEEPRPIRESNTEIPTWLDALIRKLLAKDPAQRFTSAEEVAEVLGDYLARLQRGEAIVEEVPDDLSGLHDAALDVGPATLAGVEDVGPEKMPRERRGGAWRWAAAASVLGLVALGTTEALGVTRLGELVATVLRIRVPEGILVLEVDDPETKVAIDGGDVVVHGGGVRELKLKAGQHQVQALRGGMPTRVELVEIRKGDKQTLRIGLEPDEVVARPIGEPGPGGVFPESMALQAAIGRERARVASPLTMAEQANPGLDERVARAERALQEAARRRDAGEIGELEYLKALDDKLGADYWIAVRDEERARRESDRKLLEAIDAAARAEAEARRDPSREGAKQVARATAIEILRARLDGIETGLERVLAVQEAARAAYTERLAHLDPVTDRDATFELTKRLEGLDQDLARQRDQGRVRERLAWRIRRLEPGSTSAAEIFRSAGFPPIEGNPGLVGRSVERLEAIRADSEWRTIACEQEAEELARALPSLDAAAAAADEAERQAAEGMKAGTRPQSEALAARIDQLATRDRAALGHESVEGARAAERVWGEIEEAAVEDLESLLNSDRDEPTRARAERARSLALRALLDRERMAAAAARGEVERKEALRGATRELLTWREGEVGAGRLAEGSPEILEARRQDATAAGELEQARERRARRERRVEDLELATRSAKPPSVAVLHALAAGMPPGEVGATGGRGPAPGRIGAEPAGGGRRRNGEGFPGGRDVFGGMEFGRRMRRIGGLLGGLGGEGRLGRLLTPGEAPEPPEPPGGPEEFNPFPERFGERLLGLEEAMKEIDAELESLKGQAGDEVGLEVEILERTRDELRRALEELRRERPTPPSPPAPPPAIAPLPR